jgi:hypothetical protein
MFARILLLNEVTGIHDLEKNEVTATIRIICPF